MSEEQLSLKDQHDRRWRRMMKRLVALMMGLGLVGMSGYALYLT